MKMVLLFNLCLLAFAQGGCAYKYQYFTGATPDLEQEEVCEWRNIVVWGYVAAEPFNLEEACPQGVAEFGSYISFLNWVCTFFTFGFYSPATVYAIPAKQKVE